MWIVDSEHWPRACLRVELIERGYDAVGYIELDRALAALRCSRSGQPRVIVLEVRGQILSREKLAALADTHIPIIALAGVSERSDPLVKNFG